MKSPRKVNSPHLEKIMRNTSPITVMEIGVKMSLSVKLENMIKERGWTKTVFAEKMKKRPSEISKWLSGYHNFTIDTLCEIAVVLGIHFRDLFAENKIQVIETKLVANVPPSDFRYPMCENKSIIQEPQIEYSASILNKENKRIHNSKTPGDVFVDEWSVIKSIEILESTFRLPNNYDQQPAIIHFDLKMESEYTTIPGEIRSVITVRTHVEKFLLEVGILKAAFIFATKATEQNEAQIPDELLASIHNTALSTMRGLLYAQWRGTFLHNAILPEVDVKHGLKS